MLTRPELQRAPQVLILTGEPCVHLLVTPFYVEVLGSAPVVQQLIVLTAGG